MVNSVLLAILLMAAVTYLIRVAPLVLIRREIKNKTVRSFLYYVPYVTLSVMTVPAIFLATGVIWSALAAFLVAVVLSLSGQKLPAYLYGCPEMYIQCKEKDGVLAVGLWNFFADPVFTPTVELDEAYGKIHPINCTAHIDGNRVTLSDIPPFGFVGFEVLK